MRVEELRDGAFRTTRLIMAPVAVASRERKWVSSRGRVRRPRRSTRTFDRVVSVPAAIRARCGEAVHLVPGAAWLGTRAARSPRGKARGGAYWAYVSDEQRRQREESPAECRSIVFGALGARHEAISTILVASTGSTTRHSPSRSGAPSPCVHKILSVVFCGASAARQRREADQARQGSTPRDPIARQRVVGPRHPGPSAPAFDDNPQGVCSGDCPRTSRFSYDSPYAPRATTSSYHAL